jgi:sugar phosphate isomerase/epimerase
VTPPLRFGYGTNGLADHRLHQALEMLADLGYDGVALTLDHQHLDPYADDLAATVAKVRRLLDRLELAVVIETGARYLLDPRRKHQPTLLSSRGREQRLDLLTRAITIGAELDAEAVSFWSGTATDDVPDQIAWTRLVDGCQELAARAADADVQLGFEPEPGMLVATLADYERLVAAVDADPHLGLTLDIGHCHCLEDQSVVECIHRAAGRIVNVQIEDMRRGVHEHLPFGEGEIDFPPVIAALREIGYAGGVNVELSRHSHVAPQMLRESYAFLSRLMVDG